MKDRKFRIRRAFTLIEMIVVISIIAVLVGILLVSLRGVRGTARNTASMNSLKQLSVAYSSYMSEHNYRLMPGYLSKVNLDYFDAQGTPIAAHLPNGTPLTACNPGLGICDRSSYVWRLAPYLSDRWDTYLTDIRQADVIEALQSEFTHGVYGQGTSTSAADIGISDHPAYGLNSIFLGGDGVHGGPVVLPLNPWSGPTYSNPNSIAATRFTQVKNPSKIILFAPAATAWTSMGATDLLIGYQNPNLGYAELRPPFTILDTGPPSGKWINCQWIVGQDGNIERRLTGDYSDGAGLPVARGGVRNRLPVSHLDGSASIEDLAEISNDMTRWAPGELIQREVDPNG